MRRNLIFKQIKQIHPGWIFSLMILALVAGLIWLVQPKIQDHPGVSFEQVLDSLQQAGPSLWQQHWLDFQEMKKMMEEEARLEQILQKDSLSQADSLFLINMYERINRWIYEN